VDAKKLQDRGELERAIDRIVYFLSDEIMVQSHLISQFANQA